MVLLAVLSLLAGCGWKKPEPVIEVSPSPPYIPGEVLTFDGSGSFSRNPDGRIIKWDWRITGPGLDWTTTGKSCSKALPSSGTYQVTLEVIDNYSRTNSETIGFEVTAIELHLDFKWEPKHPRKGDIVTFTGFIQICGECTKRKVEANPLNWTWKFMYEGELKAKKTGRIVDYVFKSQGNYKVKLTVTDPRTGAHGTTSKIIEVAPM